MKKLLISFLVGLTIFLSFAPYLSPAKAQTTWYNQTFQEWYGKVYDPNNASEIFGERYTAAQVQWIVYSVWGFLINTVVGPQNSSLIQCFISNSANISTCTDQMSKLLTNDPVQNQAMATSNAPKQSLLSLIFTSNRPISGIAYVRERLDRLNPVSIVHAQAPGTGFNALQPVQEIWTVFRNVSFGLFVLVAIVFAFMIMFRVKLSPQTVISVQSALPKIILSLILVTFSYAIAGFLIDLMYVVIGLVSLIGSQLFTASPAQIFNLLTLGQPIGGSVNIGVLGLLIIYVVGFSICVTVLVLINIANMGALFASITITALLSTGIGEVLVIVGILAAIILIIVALFMAFKIIWGLLKAFVNILLLTIFAPIQLTLGTVVPNLGFGAWFKSFVSNLAVFVVTGALILFSFIFLSKGASLGLQSFGLTNSGINFGIFVSNIVKGSAISGQSNAAWPPLLGTSGNAGVGLLFVIVSFVLFTLIPKANEIIQGFITGRPFAYGTAIGEAFGPVSAAAGYGAAKMARGGELPWPVSSLYTRVTGKTAPTKSTTLQAIGETYQNITKSRGK
jgi:hypothetical protein